MRKWIKQIFGPTMLPEPAAIEQARKTVDVGKVQASRQQKELGDEMLASEDFPAAESLYRRAIALRPDYAKAYVNLGFALHAQGRAREAAHALTKALAIDPALADAHYLLASHQRNSGNVEEAERHFRMALELAPDLEAAYLELCTLLHEHGRTAEALELMNIGVSRNPAIASLHYYLGNLYHELLQPDWAIDSFHAALALQPSHQGALNNLGLVLFKQGDFNAAVTAFQSVLALHPLSADAHNNLGNALQRLDRFDEALACYEQAIAIDANFIKAQINLGNTLRAKADVDQAVRRYRIALEIEPHNAEAHAQSGIALEMLGQTAAAISSYRASLAIRPADIETLNNLGCLLQGHEEYAEALICHRNALALDPNNADTHYNIGVLFGNQARLFEGASKREKLDSAISSYREALASRPNHIHAANNIGTALNEIGSYEEAAYWFKHVLYLDDRFSHAHHNLGGVLTEMARCSSGRQKLDYFEQALVQFEAALAINPEHADSYVVIGAIMASQLRNVEAMRYYERALLIDPESHKANFNKSLLLLLLGDFANGWAGYENRLRVPDSPVPASAEANWFNDQPLTGRTILLSAEQGMGDTIQFVRYVAKIRALGPKAVYLRVQRALLPLLDALPGLEVFCAEDEVPPECDFHCPLASLPYAFHTELASIPAVVPYLFARPDRCEVWSRRLADYRSARIGIVWAGNPKFRHDAARSVALKTMAALLCGSGYQFFSLQRDPRNGDLTLLQSMDHVVDLAPHLDDFAETAAAIANLDLVITVDTAVAHLAGAMAKPVWILLPFAPDFRWMVERSDSPWYPTARLFRQSSLDDWETVITEVRVALAAHFPTGTEHRS